MKSIINIFLTYSVFLFLLLTTSGFTQLDYAPCTTPLSSSDFTVETLFNKASANLAEPLKMAFDMDDQGIVDIYFVERPGNVRLYNGETQTVTTLATLSQVSFVLGQGGNNDGLVGIALDPNFKNNGWVYLAYTFDYPGDTPDVNRLSRFKITNGNFDTNSELILLENMRLQGLWHTGGDLQFDDYGDLWYSIGDNTVDESGPGNTNDLRGKIVRIRPIPVPDGQNPQPGIGTTYTIPEGNLFPVGTAQTKPEIYTMGNRNSYTIELDPVRRWLAWGEVGPDLGKVTEEYNLVTEPGNMGWPYFSGDNVAITASGSRYEGSNWGTKNPTSPTNNSSNNTGLTNLPPAVPAIYPYQQSCAISGPIYRYNPDLQSSVKFPPHFDRAWLVADCNNANIQALFPNEQGTAVTGPQMLTGGLFPSGLGKTILDFEAGPDGAIYYLNYNGSYSTGADAGIYRIDYNGTCKPNRTDYTGTFEKVGCMDPAYLEYDSLATHEDTSKCLSLTGIADRVPHFKGNILAHPNLTVSIQELGWHEVEVFTLLGKSLAKKAGENFQSYEFSQLPKANIYFVSVKTKKGTSLKKVSL